MTTNQIETRIREQEEAILKLTENLFFEIGYSGVMDHIQDLMIRYFNPLIPDLLGKDEVFPKQEVADVTYNHAVLTKYFSSLYEAQARLDLLKRELDRLVPAKERAA
jgi:hypothetical protein